MSKPEAGVVIVPDVDEYIKKVKHQKKETASGDWYWDITKGPITDKEGNIKIYKSLRRVVTRNGKVVRTKSGAPKRETKPGSSTQEILVQEKTA